MDCVESLELNLKIDLCGILPTNKCMTKACCCLEQHTYINLMVILRFKRRSTPVCAFKKGAQNVDQSILCLNFCIPFTVVKNSTKIWATSVFCKNQSKVNNRLIGENSPNLATLISATVIIFHY
jgi:hypothetical protein